MVAYFKGSEELKECPNQEQENIAIDFEMEIDLPTFNGNMVIEAFLDWIKNVNFLFIDLNRPKEKKI